MLTLVLATLLYLFIGYGIGKVANKEYFDDTNTSKLGLFRKLKRILLFPISYGEWGERAKIQNEFPNLRRILDAENLQCTKKLKEKYYRLTTFLWPLKLSLVAVGIVIILYRVFFEIFYLISFIPSLGETYTKSSIRSLDKATRKFLPATCSSDLSSHIDELESTISDLIINKKSEMEARIVEIEEKVSELRQNLTGWQNLLAQPDQPDYENIQTIVETIQANIDRSTQEAEKTKIAVRDLTTKINVLSNQTAKLVQCKKTMALDIPITDNSGNGFLKSDGMAVLARATIESAQLNIAQCRELVK